MVKNVKFLTTSSSYRDAKELLESYTFRAFPLVESSGCTIIYLDYHGLSNVHIHIPEPCNSFDFRVENLAWLGAARRADPSSRRNAESRQTQRLLQGHGSSLHKQCSSSRSHHHAAHSSSRRRRKIQYFDVFHILFLIICCNTCD